MNLELLDVKCERDLCAIQPLSTNLLTIYLNWIIYTVFAQSALKKLASP